MSPRNCSMVCSCVPGAVALLVLGCAGAPAPAAAPSAGPSATAPSESPAAQAAAPAPSESSPAASAASAEASPPAPHVQVQGCPEPKDHTRTQLAGPDVQALVSANKSHLNETCWKPEIDKNSKGPDKVRVATELQVDPDGRVTDVKVVGGKDYPGFAACLERELRSWCFPGAKQPSSLMFPMVFEKAEGEMVAVPRGSAH